MPTSGERRGMTGKVERSLARLEKLVESAKSTLSDTRRSSLDHSPDGRLNYEDFLFEKKLKEVESNFKSDANEILSKMDKMLGSNKSLFLRKGASEVHKKIKEINEIIESRSKVTRQSRNKLMSLINEKELKTPPNGFGKRNQEKSLPEEKNLLSKKASTHVSDSSIKTKDLRDKILQTEEIVDRGFQTARQLAQKVESIAKTEKKIEETTVIKENEYPLDKTNVTGRETCEVSVEGPVMIRKEKKKKLKSDSYTSRKSMEKNCSLVTFQEKECKVSRPVLKFQQLPSLRIKGGLQIQKVHSLEILPEKENDLTEKANTGLHIVSHESISEEKAKELLRNLLKNDSLENAAKCPNCGKSVRASERTVNPNEVDDILRQCNFNVFDSRIEEFVEKCGRGATIQTDLVVEKVQEVPLKIGPLEKTEETKTTIEEKKIGRVENRVRINELCSSLSRKYKEKALGLKDDHDALNNIIRDLFQRVDESRKLFGDLRHFSAIETSTEVRHLKATKPIVVSLPGEPNICWKQLELNGVAEGRSNELKLPEKEMLQTCTIDLPRKIKNKKHSKSGLTLNHRKDSAIKSKMTGSKKLVHSSSSSSSTTVLSVFSSKESRHSKKYETSKSDYESDFEGESGETSKEKNKKHSPKSIEGGKSQKGSPNNRDFEGREIDKYIAKIVPVETLTMQVDILNPDVNTSPKADSKKDDHSLIEESESSRGSQKKNMGVPRVTTKTHLTEVLSVLEDRIIRTQSLAEKLIIDPEDKKRDVLNEQQNTEKLLEKLNLSESSGEKCKNQKETKQKSGMSSSSESGLLSDKGSISPVEDLMAVKRESSEGKSSSLGEVIQEDVDRQSESGSDRHALKLNSRLLFPGQDSLLLINPREISHSEGEILSEVQADIESSSINSLGEVV